MHIIIIIMVVCRINSEGKRERKEKTRDHTGGRVRLIDQMVNDSLWDHFRGREREKREEKRAFNG